jgi:hypothetical protein
MSVATISPAPLRRFSKNPFVAFYQSSIGKRIIADFAVIPIVILLGFLK